MSWVCCNSCFHMPRVDRQLSLTSCGHLICSFCLQRGTQKSCLICNAKCDTWPVSDKSSAEVKAMFSNLHKVTDKHLSEITKVLMFQGRHQKRLLVYYQKRNEQLQQTLDKMQQEMQQKLNAKNAYITKLENALRQQSAKASAQKIHSSGNAHGPQPALQMPHTSPMTFSRYSSTANLVESMEVDEGSLFRRPSTLPRLSLTSPSLAGQMGAVSHRLTNENMLANYPTSSATVSRFQAAPVTPAVSFGQTMGWNTPLFRPQSSYGRTSVSSLAPFRANSRI